MKTAPIRMTTGNLVAATSLSDVWAVYRVRCRSYRAEPRRRQAQMAAEFATYARTVEADFQILRVTRRWSADEYTERLRAAMPARAHADEYRAYLDAQHAALEDVDPWQPSTFVSVRLADAGRDLHAHASRVFDQTPGEWWRQARGRARVRGSGTLVQDDIEDRERVATERIRSCLDARPATPEEIQWLIRRSFTRGLGDPELAPVEKFEHPWEEAQKSTLRWAKEDIVERHHRYLRVHSELGDSYQAGLCLGEMDHTTPFTAAAELLFTPLEAHSFPVDACLNVRWVDNEQALRKAGHHVGRSHHQLADEAGSATGARDDGYERTELARELQTRLKGTGEPLLYATLSLVVSTGVPRIPASEDTAEARDLLERQVRAVRQSFPHPVYRAVGDLLDVFHQHLPAQRSRTTGYERPFTCEQIGAMIPHGTHEAGSDTARAFYIGRTLDGGHPVRLDLREAASTNQAPTIALLGSLGGGKTLAAQMLMYQAFLQGARVVDTDPKGDHRLHLYPQVAPYAQTIVLGPQAEHAGKLDPLRIAPTNERHDAAATFLLDVLPAGVGPGIHAAINGAVSRVVDAYGKRAACLEVVKALEASEDEDDRKAGRMLAQFASGGLARLGFARLGDPLPTSAAAQYTYIQIRALKRAAANTVRSEMSQSQQHGRAVLQLVALYGMRILGDERDRLKVLSFDETSFIGQDAVGQQHIDQLVRWGRSELAVPILSTQLLSDVTAQDNLVGQYLVFKMRSREHARVCLDSMELDGTGPLNRALTETYRDGMCLYRDLRGHCEELQIDFADRALFEALKTTPEDEDEAIEELRSVV